jgi:hypothetical protein
MKFSPLSAQNERTIYSLQAQEQQKTEGAHVDLSTSIHQRSSIVHRHQRAFFLADVQRHIVRAFE